MEIKCKYHPEIEMEKDIQPGFLSHKTLNKKTGYMDHLQTGTMVNLSYCSKCGYSEIFIAPEHMAIISAGHLVPKV